MDIEWCKDLKWVGTALDDVRAFPKEARIEAGYQLDRVQHGKEPKDWKPMTSIGPGVKEIRIHESGEHRVIYFAKFAEAVYVLHAFQKKSQKTTQRDLQCAKERLNQVLRQRPTKLK